jgi:hypothetical protein
MLSSCQLAALLKNFGESTMNKMRITMSSEWFVRSPEIGGNRIERDINNLPYIPSSIVAEILYDSCRSIVVALDSNYDNSWHHYLEYLFDLQSPQLLLDIESAYLLTDLKYTFQDKTKLQEALAFTKSIDPSRRSNIVRERPVERLEEFAHKGAILQDNYSFNFDNLNEDAAQALQALFIAGILSIKNLENRRYLCGGKCQIILPGYNLAEVFQILKTPPPPLLCLGQLSRSRHIMGSNRQSIDAKIAIEEDLAVNESDDRDSFPRGLGDIYDRLVTKYPGDRLSKERQSTIWRHSGSFSEVDDLAGGYIRTIERQAWWEAIRRESLILASDPQQRREFLGLEIETSMLLAANSMPSFSELKALKTIAIVAVNTARDRHEVFDNWCDKIPANVRQRLPEVCLAKVRDSIVKPDSIWWFLEEIDFFQLTVFPGNIKTLKKELWSKTVETLIVDTINAHQRDTIARVSCQR